MRRKSRSIDQLLDDARRALEEGRHDDALTSVNVAKTNVQREIEKLREKVENIDAASSSDIGRLAGALEELGFKKRSIDSLQKTIKKEKNRAKCFRKLVERIGEADVVDRISKEQASIEATLSKQRTLNPSDRYLLFLRRWNSYTPLLANTSRSSQGGGYFLVWNGKGLVVDPGIGFLQNMISFGYSVCDVDAIVLTHSHIDHTADLEAIFTVVHEMNSVRRDQGMEARSIDVFMNVGVANKFMHLLAISYDSIGKIVIVNPKSHYSLAPDITLDTCPAYHTDLYADRTDCLGLIFSCTAEDRQAQVGFTGDTGYSPELSSVYSSLKDGMIVLHIGSILERELDPRKPTDRVYSEHLGLRGTFNILYDIRPRFAVISEIGEELRETITPIAKCLGRIFPKTVTIPGDIGLKVDLSTFGKPYKVECQECHSFVGISAISFEYNTDQNGIRYVCQNCNDTHAP